MWREVSKTGMAIYIYTCGSETGVARWEGAQTFSTYIFVVCCLSLAFPSFDVLGVALKSNDVLSRDAP